MNFSDTKKCIYNGLYATLNEVVLKKWKIKQPLEKVELRHNLHATEYKDFS